MCIVNFFYETSNKVNIICFITMAKRSNIARDNSLPFKLHCSPTLIVRSRGAARGYKYDASPERRSLFHSCVKECWEVCDQCSKVFRMPQSMHVNGYANGHSGSFDMEDGSVFLFTSESVGEGHPGLWNIKYIL